MASERRLYVSRNHDRIYIDCAHLGSTHTHTHTFQSTTSTPQQPPRHGTFLQPELHLELADER